MNRYQWQWRANEGKMYAFQCLAQVFFWLTKHRLKKKKKKKPFSFIISKCGWWEQLLGRQCRQTPGWEVFPLIQCNNLLTISEGQFHALFPRLLGHPPKNPAVASGWWCMCWNVVNVAFYPQALLPIAHAKIQSYILTTNPSERCIISSIWSLARPCS